MSKGLCYGFVHIGCFSHTLGIRITKMEISEKIKKIGVPQALDDLSGNFFSYLRYVLCRIRKKTYFGSYLAATQGKINRHYYMQELVKHYCQTGKHKIRILEIGSWAGGSAITWADAIKKYSDHLGSVYCVDPWVNYCIGSPKDNKSWIHKTMSKALNSNKIFYLFNYNIYASGHSDVVFPLKGFSDDLLPLLKDKQLDIIFIDGSHLFEAVYKDISNSAPLVKDGGIICGDDLELQYGDVAIDNIENLTNVDIWIDNDNRKRFHPGVTLAVWKYFQCEVSCWDGFWAMKKRGNMWERIPLDIDRNNFAIPKHFM